MADLQRHERPPIAMGANFTYRSVFDFEEGLGSEAVVLEPEATPPNDDPAPLVGGGVVGVFVSDDAGGFIEAAVRCMAARPLALIARA